MMRILSNIDKFSFNAYINIINNFIGEPKAVKIDSTLIISEDTIEFVKRLANAIIENKPNCNRNCPFRKN